VNFYYLGLSEGDFMEAQHHDLSALDAEIGSQLTSLTMGMDRFERQQTQGEGALDSEGLVPIYLGDHLVSPTPLQSWSDAESMLHALKQEASKLPSGARRSFLISMIGSLETAAALFQGRNFSYGEKLERLVCVPNAPVSETLIGDLREELDSLLGEAGFTNGTLRTRVESWERDRALPPGDLEQTFRELMSDAKARTDTMIFPTGDYTMALAPVSGVPYTARCNFSEGEMDLNIDLSFTRSSLKHLVAHEVFPGHSTQLLFTLAKAERGESPPDVLLCTTNGATGAVQEGIGDQGIHLIDWIEDVDDSLHLTLRRLRSAGQTTAAWQLMEGGWSEAQTRTYLEEHLFGQPAWVNGRLRFTQHPFRGPFIASYWYGDEAVREVRENSINQRDEFIEFLYGQMNTPESLRMFRA
jgi:hypothetical protein